MKRIKLFNNTLHNISKKRQAEIAAGTYRPKPRKPLKTMSAKQRAKTKDYRATAFEYRGRKCFLCGRTEPYTHLVVHHFDCNRNNNSPENLYPLCDKNFGCGAHNHMGKEGLEELNRKIREKQICRIF